MVFNYIIYIAAGLLAAFSLILAVANLVYLAGLSGKINAAEQEIDKKALEFDALRKEKTFISPSTSALEEGVTESVVSTTPANGQGDSSQIQIFRNVRTYQYADSATVKPHGDPTTPEPAAPQNHPEQVIPGPSLSPLTIPYEPMVSNAVPPQDGILPGGDSTVQAPAFTDTPMDEGDIMDVVTDEEQDHNAGSPPSIVIRLYSETKKDADFEKLSLTLRECSSAAQAATIILDFSFVLFLYPAELDYLRKIEAFIRDNGSRLQLVRCGGELLNTLLADPILAPLIRE